MIEDRNISLHELEVLQKHPVTSHKHHQIIVNKLFAMSCPDWTTWGHNTTNWTEGKRLKGWSLEPTPRNCQWTNSHMWYIFFFKWTTTKLSFWSSSRWHFAKILHLHYYIQSMTVASQRIIQTQQCLFDLWWTMFNINPLRKYWSEIFDLWKKKVNWWWILT